MKKCDVKERYERERHGEAINKIQQILYEALRRQIVGWRIRLFLSERMK